MDVYEGQSRRRLQPRRAHPYLAIGLLVGMACLRGSVAADTPSSIDPVLRLAPLEPERSGPSTHPAVSAIPRRDGYGTVRLASQANEGDPKYDIWLLVPARFIGPGTNRVTEAWAINLFVYYPAMTGEFDPGTKDKVCWTCTSQPPGQLLVYIANDHGFGGHGTSDPERSYQALKDGLRIGAASAGKKSDIDASNPDEIIINEGTNFPPSSQQKHFLFSDRGKVLLFVSCFQYAPVPSCTAHTMSEHRPGLAIRFFFKMALLNDWRQMRAAVIKLIDGFVVDQQTPAP